MRPHPATRWLLLGLLILLPGMAAQGASERQLKETELRQLRTQIETLQQEMNRVRNRHDRLQQELRQSEQAIGRINRNIRELESSAQLTQERIGQLRQRQQTLRRSLDGQREHLAGQVRAAYAMGRQETIKILLNQENPSTVGRVMTYYDYLNKARTVRIADLNNTISELEQIRQTLDEELERLRVLRAERQQERQALEQTSQQRQQVLTQLDAELQDKDQRLGNMQQNETRLAELIRALVDALDDIPKHLGNEQAFATLRGQLQLPARGPILASFGSPRNLGGLNWQGIKIGATEGDEVRAVSHGRVAFADWLRGYGLLLIIEHGDGYMSLYGNNQSLFKEVGDWVSRNEVIASVGDNASESRGGLYFEIRKDGRPQDPVRWVRR